MSATLYIDISRSNCGACGRNADPHEKAHLNENMAGEGCGAVYTGLASNYTGFEQRLCDQRPDLPWVGIPFGPPRIPEPGWGAIVEARTRFNDDRLHWQRTTHHTETRWECQDTSEYTRKWSDLVEPVVVRDAVEKAS